MRPKYRVAAKGCAFYQALAGQYEEDAIKKILHAAVAVRAVFLPAIIKYTKPR